MFLRSGPDKATLTHLERIESAVRGAYGLGPETVVLVREEAVRLPGYPPRVTVARFPDAAGRAIRWAVYRPAAEVAKEDLPPAYLLSLYIDDGSDCC